MHLRDKSKKIEGKHEHQNQNHNTDAVRNRILKLSNGVYDIYEYNEKGTARNVVEIILGEKILLLGLSLDIKCQTQW